MQMTSWTKQKRKRAGVVKDAQGLEFYRIQRRHEGQFHLEDGPTASVAVRSERRPRPSAALAPGHPRKCCMYFGYVLCAAGR